MRLKGIFAGAVAAAVTVATLGGVQLTAGGHPGGTALLTTRTGSAEALASLSRSPASPAAGSPVAGSPVAGSPVAGSRVAGSPVAGSPVAGSPVAGSPVAGSLGAGLPTPGSRLPSLPAPGPRREVDAVVTLPTPATPAEINQLVHTPGLAAIEKVDTGTVTLAGSPAVTFGVDPSTFRDFTPNLTYQDTRLWQYLAAGALASSYEMATDRKLPLGSRLPLIPAGTRAPVGGSPATSGWVGAFAAIGIPGVDMVVSRAYSSALGLVPDGGLVVSAPGMDQYALKQALSQDLPGANIELTNASVAVTANPGASVGASVMSTVISAALSRVGKPYVWGGDGPNQFDCSGLVGWAFAQAGISMPRTAAQQYLAGIHVPMSQLQPGDLLFWAYDPADPGFVDHVAMYLGHGKMVVAPHTGTDVQVDPVPTADLVGATRVEPAVAAQVGGPRFP